MRMFERHPLRITGVQWTGHNEAQVKELAGDAFQSVTQCTEGDTCANCADYPDITGELFIAGHGDDDGYVQGVETGHWVIKTEGGMLSVMPDSTLRYNYSEITYAGSD